MTNSLSSFVENLAEILHEGKYKDCKPCLNYMRAKDGLLVFKCVNCNKNQRKAFHGDLAKGFVNTYRFCDDDINKFCLMLGVYPIEYMDSCKRFNETSLPGKITLQ